MPFSLDILRQLPQPTSERFLAAQPGCWVQYYDDTEAKDPAKALSTRSFNRAVAQRKQQEWCAVCFSLQAFDKARTREEILSYRNMGVDVDLVSATEKRTFSLRDIERRKDEYLASCLQPFHLKPHWIVETLHGFHIIFRVMPLRFIDAIRVAATLNRRLVTALRGDQNATLLTQVLRVPGTYQYKNPHFPFLCRLLLDNANTIPPYGLHIVRSVLDAWDVFHSSSENTAAARMDQGVGNSHPAWPQQSTLEGVPEGQRNTTAASIVGSILVRLPEHLWETAGWGGLKEWNQRNSVPLPERELRSVFQSIARREQAKRRSWERSSKEGNCSPNFLVRPDVRSGSDEMKRPASAEIPDDGPRRISGAAVHGAAGAPPSPESPPSPSLASS